MPFERIGNLIMLDATRAQFGPSSTAADFLAAAAMPRLQVLQCDAPVPDDVWRQINQLFCPLRPEVTLRVHLHLQGCDLSFTRLLTNARAFAADSLQQATNVGCVAEMPELESLALDIQDLVDFDVLERVSPRLKHLSLEATHPAPSLRSLRRFTELRSLHLAGRFHDIEVLGHLRSLQQLSLATITSNLHFLRPLDSLESLHLSGRIHDFSGIYGKQRLRQLTLGRIRGLKDVDFLTSLPRLQYFACRSLTLDAPFPDLARARSLHRVAIVFPSGLEDFDDFVAFEYAPRLTEFALLEGYGQRPEQLLSVLRNPSVQRARATFGASQHKNDAFAKLRDRYGKADFDPSQPFAPTES